jgi:hypothetical protein
MDFAGTKVFFIAKNAKRAKNAKDGLPEFGLTSRF